MKRFGILLMAIAVLVLTACTSGKQTTGSSISQSYLQNSQEEAEEMMEQDEFGGNNDWTDDMVTDAEPEPGVADSETRNGMILKIDGKEVPVTWEENASVEALSDLADQNPLVIQMSQYGDFEQVGPIGQDIPRDDQQTAADYGDIVLYSGDQIVIFYGSNSWEYTRLGHIEFTQEKMEDLLGEEDVMITIQTGGVNGDGSQ